MFASMQAPIYERSMIIGNYDAIKGNFVGTISPKLFSAVLGRPGSFLQLRLCYYLHGEVLKNIEWEEAEINVNIECLILQDYLMALH